MIGVLPGEGEALAQFDSVFLTQCHWELLSRGNFSRPWSHEAKLSYTVKIIDGTIERIGLLHVAKKGGRVLYGQKRRVLLYELAKQSIKDSLF